MDLFRISSLVGILCNLGLTVFFLSWKGKKHSSAKWFAGFTLSAVVWHLGAFMLAGYPISGYDEAFFWWKVAYMGAFFAIAFFFHFIVEYLGLARKHLIFTVYSAAVVFSFFNWYHGSRYFLGDIYFVFDKFYWIDALKYKNPIWLFFYVSFYWVALGYGFYLLLNALKDSSAARRNKLRYLILASGFGWIGTNPLFLPAFHVAVYPYTNFFVATYPLLVAYAVVRHHVMDIEFVIKKTIVFAGLFISAYAVFSGFVYVGSAFFEHFTGNRWIAMIPSVLIVVLMLRPLENMLRAMTDKILFQKKYDEKKLLKTFTDEVLTVLGLSDLVNLTVNKLCDVMKLENASIFLYDDDSEDYRMAGSSGVENPGIAIPAGDKAVQYLNFTGRHIDLEGIDTRGSLLFDDTRFLALKPNILVPLITREKLTGVLVLGKKKSDESFTQDDLDILLPLARALSIAITNARLFVELSKAQAMAAQQEKMAVIGTLSAGINHEICNPLGIVRGQCEMFLLNMKEGLYKDKTDAELLGKAQEIMDKVIRETDRATGITRKLSSFAKPPKGKIEDNVRIGDEVNEVISLLHHDLRLENISVVKDIERDLPPIAADKKQIQEIFFNIIRNAAQSIEGRGQVAIRAVSAGKKVYVDIKDTGAGISKKNLGQIFDPFFTTKDPGKGTGLGLFITKQIVERNGGTISVQSEVGKGTSFRLVFASAESHEGKESVPGEGPAMTPESEKIIRSEA